MYLQIEKDHYELIQTVKIKTERAILETQNFEIVVWPSSKTKRHPFTPKGGKMKADPRVCLRSTIIPLMECERIFMGMLENPVEINKVEVNPKKGEL